MSNKMTEEELSSLRERFQNANNPTVISLLDHITATEERIKKLRKALTDGIFAIGGSASEESSDEFLCLLPEEIWAHRSAQMKDLLTPKPIPIELELAKITQTNTDRVPVDFTVSEGIANLQIDDNKAWI